MKFRLVLVKKVQKELQNIDRKYSLRITSVLVALQENPYLGKRLKGELEGLYSYRVGPYRIIYEIRHKELVVLVITIGHRRDVYK